MAIDNERAMAAFKIAAEAGDAQSQSQVGIMYCNGHGVAVDYEQARPWLEKAAAQDDPDAIGLLGVMYSDGNGVIPSWRRARELWQRAIELGHSTAVENMRLNTKNMAEVPSCGILTHTNPPSFAQILSFVHPISSCRSPPS